ncbi:caspase domain-containing protein [Streptomyces sp. NPDC050161]|uniref:caspase domain-containing protein n=1 Tax=Streptomyces sp. NPDC050161 TaxID=3365604 RepID=UPI003789A7DE
MARFALLLGNHTFHDTRLDRLRSPAQDVTELSQVLADPDIGAFGTSSVDNPSHAALRDGVEQFLSGRKRDDVLLLYYSGHGIKEGDELYLAGADTSLDALPHTALSAGVLKDWLSACRSQRIVLILDCCYSGAFAERMVPKSESRMHVQEFFGGSGLTLITATTAREYAFESGQLADEEPHPSVFTGELIRGLRTGAADLDNDGEITLDELYQYVFDAVHATHSGQQTPCRWIYGARGRMVIARRHLDTAGPGPAERPEPAPDPDPLCLLPARRQALTAVPPAAVGAVGLWWGWSGWRAPLTGVAFVSACLLVASLAGMAVRLFGRTVLAADAVHVRGWHRTRIPWPSVLAIETRKTLFATTVALRRADTAVVRRLVLAAPRSHWPFGPPGFDQHVATLRHWSLRRGSPAPVHHGTMWLPLRGVGAVVLVGLTLFVGIDRPWTRGGPDVATVPRACSQLDHDAAASLSLTYPVVSPDKGTDTKNDQNSLCRWQYSVVLFGNTGNVSLEYTRYETNAAGSGDRHARRHVSAAKSDASRAGHVSAPPGLGADGFAAESDDGHTRSLVSAQGNIAVTLVFHSRAREQLPLPDTDKLLRIQKRAMAAADHG